MGLRAIQPILIPLIKLIDSISFNMDKKALIKKFRFAGLSISEDALLKLIEVEAETNLVSEFLQSIGKILYQMMLKLFLGVGACSGVR